MSLPETIWWCENHNSQALDGECWFWLTGQVNGPCRIVALSVAGPDDLLIRREDIDYEAAVERAAKAICGELLHGEFRDAGLESMHRDREFCSFSRELALAAIRAFHNEGNTG